MIADGCVIAAGALVERSVLSPGVRVQAGAVLREAVVLTDSVVEAGAVVERAILDKRVCICEGARVGESGEGAQPAITMVGKNSRLPPNLTVQAGAVIGTDVVPSDFLSETVGRGETIQTQRQPYEVRAR